MALPLLAMLLLLICSAHAHAEIPGAVEGAGDPGDSVSAGQTDPAAGDAGNPAAANSDDPADGDTGDSVDTGEILDDLLSNLSYGELSDALESLPDSFQSLWPEGDLGTLLERLTSGESLLPEDYGESTLRALFTAICKKESGNLFLLCGLAILGAILSALSDQSETGSYTVASFLLRCMVVSCCVLLSVSAFSTTKQMLSAVGTTVSAAVPLLLTLLTAMGATASSGLFQPLNVLLCGTVTELV